MLKAAKYLLASQPNVIDYGSTSRTSWLLFLVSAILFFCAVAFRNLLEDGKSYRNESAEQVLARWGRAK
jgi:hypothetical protein